MTDLPIAETSLPGTDAIDAPLGSSTRSAGRRFKDALLGYLFLLPALAAFAAFAYYPLYRLIYDSVHHQSRFLNRPPTYVGFAQLWDTLRSSEFTSGLGHSALFMLYSVPLGLVLGVLLAVAAHRRLRGIKIYQAIFSSTIASSVAVASVIFFTLVNPVVGYFKDVSWLSLDSPTSAMFSVSLSSVWQNLGLTFIIVLAALQAIPDDVDEAAMLDGFGPVRRFFRITVPLISPALLFLAIVLVISALQAYAQIEMLTGGGPAGATETLLFKIADPNGIRALDLRAGLSIGLFLLTGAVALVQYSLLSRRVHYGD
ncbi:MAG: sugar ABC transporter permease [Actinobacteria bacterium]|nr:sugar ABC transporter permease [Actinomycetota bacterium]